MSGYASRAEVVDVVRQTIATDHNGLGLSRDPARFNLAGIVRECFYYSPGYGWHSTDADFCESLRKHHRPMNDGRANLDALDAAVEEHGEQIRDYLMGALSAIVDPAIWARALASAKSCVTH